MPTHVYWQCGASSTLLRRTDWGVSSPGSHGGKFSKVAVCSSPGVGLSHGPGAQACLGAGEGGGQSNVTSWSVWLPPLQQALTRLQQHERSQVLRPDLRLEVPPTTVKVSADRRPLDRWQWLLQLQSPRSLVAPTSPKQSSLERASRITADRELGLRGGWMPGQRPSQGSIGIKH